MASSNPAAERPAAAPNGSSLPPLTAGALVLGSIADDQSDHATGARLAKSDPTKAVAARGHL